MIPKIVCGQIIFFLQLFLIKGEEALFTLNEDESINTVSDKFISFSIDPAILFSGLSIGINSQKLAQHMQPAYVRIGGPSVQFIKYINEDVFITNFDNVAKTLTISKPMWAAVNSLISSTNLTGIYWINNNDYVNGSFVSKSFNELFDYTDKLNVTVYWQLGHDCSNKTNIEYKDNLMSLYNFLQNFASKNTWKIIGNDISSCLTSDYAEDVLNSLENVTAAVMLESSNSNMQTFPRDISNEVSLPLHKFKTPFWITAPKYPNPITFTDAILWMKQISDAAVIGYNVVFRQPRVGELYSESSIYWVSLFHKRLMGQTVLKIKPTSNVNTDLYVYAHCTEEHNAFSKNGAVTILLINNDTVEHRTLIKMHLHQKKSIELHSYTFTSFSLNSTETLMNGKKLLIENLNNEELLLTPKTTRARIIHHLPCVVPSKSINFIVIPNAKIPACMNLESLNIEEDTENTEIDLQSRFGEDRKYTPLNELYKSMVKELEADEAFYAKTDQKNINEKVDLKKLLMDHVRESKFKIPLKNDIKLINKPEEDLHQKTKVVDKSKNVFETAQKKTELNRLILGKNKEIKKKEDKKALLNDLTSEEVDKILQQREKNKEYEKYKLTSSELDEIFSVLVKKFKRANAKHKRAINMEMLNMQAKESLNEDTSNNKFKELERQITSAKDKTNSAEIKNEFLPSQQRFFKRIYVPSTIKTKHATLKSSPDTIDSFESIEDQNLGFTIDKSKPTPKELFQSDLDNNNLNEEDHALNRDIQAYLASNRPVKIRENVKQRLEEYLKMPRNVKGTDYSFDNLDILDSFRDKRSVDVDDENYYSNSRNNKRIIRQSLLDKLNLNNDNPLNNIFTDNKPLLPALTLDDDHLLKLQKFVKEDILDNIKQKLDTHKEKIKEKNDEILEKLEGLKAQLRIARSIDDQKRRKYDFYEYKLLSDDHKNWKPEQLVKKGKLYEEKKAAAKRNLQKDLARRKVVRLRRNIDVNENEIESNENRIDYIPNSITKDKKDYQIPINQISTSIKTPNQLIKESRILDNKTAVKDNEITTMKAVDIITYDDDKIINTTLYSYNDKNYTFTPKYGTTKEHIQKIKLNFKPGFFERLFEAFNEFFTDIEQKITAYFFM